MVENPPPSSGDAGSIPGWGTLISFVAMGQLKPHTTIRELVNSGAIAAQLKKSSGAATRESPSAITKTQSSKKVII